MLREFFHQTPYADKAERKAALAQLQDKLNRQQLLIRQRGLPVLVLFEGWSAAGKGRLIGRTIRNLDPRFYSVTALTPLPSEEERRYPFLRRFFKVLPEAGDFAFLDGGWLEQTVRERLTGLSGDEEYAARLESVNTFERQLTDNGYVVLKFFLRIGEKEQRRRLRKLEGDIDTAWRVNDYDLWQNRRYDACLDAFDDYLSATNAPNAPWFIVDCGSLKDAEARVLEALTASIDTALENQSLAVPLLPNPFKLKTPPKLSEVDLNKSVSQEGYKRELAAKQAELAALHNRVYRSRKPVVVVYEGWDAAGKGGNIRRVTDALDPRGYEVIPIASPEPHEKARHYLWRFWTHLPKDGHIALFDRSWYGRVMVERIEGFCSQNDWQRAYREINEFEQELTAWGAVVVKFWVHIDQATQLARFTERQDTPEKRWKITDEDWRNREKWPAYEKAADEMLKKTSTDFAPWHILESNDKRYARLKALDILIREIRRGLLAGK